MTSQNTQSEAVRSAQQKSLDTVILSPRITEKAAMGTTGNVYTFNVAPDANKIEVKRAIIQMYNVTPTKVHIVRMKPKAKVTRGRRGMKKGYKKAMVYLTQGDTIAF